jgi:GTP-binding protein
MHSEPYKPFGGPDGGDGGRGGSVIVRVDTSMFDLSAYRDRPRVRADDGGPGGKNNRHGADGTDIVIPVPDGTVVGDERGPVADLVGEGTQVVVAWGGRGGRGNSSLKTRTNRAPRIAEPGEEGEDRTLELELRLVADVGLVGLPNAGKSTLLAALTAARPKIADYPFTTITPNLGVAGGGDERIVVADVPGLIEGAHEGRGLGLTFLRHVSRARALLYVVDLTGDPVVDAGTVRAEVGAYDAELGARSSLVVGTKVDLLDAAPNDAAPNAATVGVDVVVSGVTGAGIAALEDRIRELVLKAKAEAPPEHTFVVVRPGRDPFSVTRESGGWRVSGPRVERFVKETDIDDPADLLTLQRRLIKAGVERRLQREGARAGDDVTIGGITFEFQPGPADGSDTPGAPIEPPAIRGAREGGDGDEA